MKTNYEIRYAAHPEDAKQYDTTRIRRDFLIEKVFAADEVNMVYSMYDRMVVGGAMPVNEALKLEAIDPLKADFFTTRREIGIFNVGEGEGVVTVGDETFTLAFKEALYIGRGDRDVVFASKDSAHPAKFYFNSCTAHAAYPCKKITKADAVVAHMGIIGDEQRAQYQQDDCQSGAAYLSVADGYDRAGHRQCVEHHARSRTQPSYGSLFLFRGARRPGRMSFHG